MGEESTGLNRLINLFYRTESGEYIKIGEAVGKIKTVDISDDYPDGPKIELGHSYSVNFEAETTHVDLPYLKYLIGIQTNNWKKRHHIPMRRRSKGGSRKNAC